jgi:hypothetical protein
MNIQHAQQVLADELESLRNDMIDNYVQLGMRASGKWVEELAVDVVATGNRLMGSITGAHYTYQLVNGRKPGKMPPVKMIEQWLKNKGIRPRQKNMKLRSLAFLIARKIAQLGTRYHQKGGTDLIEKVVTPARIEMILEKVNEAVLAGFISMATAEFTKLEKV